MTIKYGLSVDIKSFEIDLLEALADEYTDLFKRAVPHIRSRLQEGIPSLFTSSGFYKALITDGSEVAQNFGFSPGEGARKAEIILEILSKQIEINVRPVVRRGLTLKGGIDVGIIDADFTEVINSEGGKVTTKKGQILDWLEWVLFRGNQNVVKGYRMKKGSFSLDYSKSGGAIMIPSTFHINAEGKRESRQYRVPRIGDTGIEIGGTKNNNWIVNAILVNNAISAEELIFIAFKYGLNKAS